MIVACLVCISRDFPTYTVQGGRRDRLRCENSQLTFSWPCQRQNLPMSSRTRCRWRRPGGGHVQGSIPRSWSSWRSRKCNVCKPKCRKKKKNWREKKCKRGPVERTGVPALTVSNRTLSFFLPIFFSIPPLSLSLLSYGPYLQQEGVR